MSRVLAIGIAVIDIINSVSDYPAEDDEVRALAQRICLGGNAANSLAVLSQLRHQCSWAGVCSNDQDGHFVRQQLARFHIDTQWCRLLDGKTPTSYIIHNQRTASRTIVHYRDLPEYAFTDFDRIDLSRFDWLHFEGRNIDETVSMCEKVRQQYPALPVSIEIEKNRPHIDRLFPLADLLLFSRHFALDQGFHTATDLLHTIHPHASQADIICAWGDQGATACDREGNYHHSPAYPPAQIIDTLAAGDTFNAGVIDARLRGATLEQSLHAGCQLAGKKCASLGLNFINAN